MWSDRTVVNDKESMEIQTLSENIAQVTDCIGPKAFELIESSEIPEMLESQDDELSETDIKGNA